MDFIPGARRFERRALLRWSGMFLGAGLLAACRARGAANGADVELEITTDGERMAFTQTALTVAAGRRVRLTFHNRSSVMQHNWVLVNGGDDIAAQIYAEALSAGPNNGFIPDDRARVLAHTALTNPGASATVEFTTPVQAGTYAYLCTFPGHYLAGMKGTLVVSAP